jgi:hypothetical protein
VNKGEQCVIAKVLAIVDVRYADGDFCDKIELLRQVKLYSRHTGLLLKNLLIDPIAKHMVCRNSGVRIQNEILAQPRVYSFETSDFLIRTSS